jgi:GT2 family glycosyltransferase
MKSIATLITCHNRKDKTLACLEALFQNTLPEDYLLDVFLVDDGSTDDTAQAVKAHYPQVNIIVGDGNLYWTRGMHKAWQTSAQTKVYDYYLWLNDDTYVFKNALTALLSAADSTENKAIIVAACCSETNDELTYSGFLANRDLIIPTDKLEQAHTFHGNCVLIPKFVYQQVGTIDPLFHHALGDMDYGHRAAKKCIKSFIAPGFLAYCEAHDSLLQWCLPSVPLGKRIKSLYSPLGNSQPYYYLRYALRHLGLMIAIKHLTSMHIRLLFPALWTKLKSIN